VDVDIAQAKGLTLGGAAGYFLTDYDYEAAVWSLDEPSGVWQLASAIDRRTVRQRYWLGIRVGYQNRVVQLRGMFGAARLVSSEAADPDAHPVLQMEFTVGLPGVAAYRSRFEAFGGIGQPILAQELSVFHGALLFGGDYPGVELGVRLGFNPLSVPDTRFELRLMSAQHWRVQPWIVGNLDPLDPYHHWSVQAGIQLLFGRRARFSERFMAPPRSPDPRPPRPDEPLWDDEGS